MESKEEDVSMAPVPTGVADVAMSQETSHQEVGHDADSSPSELLTRQMEQVDFGVPKVQRDAAAGARRNHARESHGNANEYIKLGPAAGICT